MNINSLDPKTKKSIIAICDLIIIIIIIITLKIQLTKKKKDFYHPKTLFIKLRINCIFFIHVTRSRRQN